MTMYITLNDDGSIAASSEQHFPDSLPVDYAVVRGVDGKLYKAGTEPKGPSENDLLLLRLRGTRDTRLDATDKYLMPDYPISTEGLAEVKAYRQALRDLPAQEGAPWDGGCELTPWPDMPTV